MKLLAGVVTNVSQHSTVEPSILGTEIIGVIIEVATFQGLIYTCVCNWDKQHVAVIER